MSYGLRVYKYNDFIKLIVLFVFLFMSICAKAQTSIFVSPTGNDANSGSKESPFRTLTKALDAVRNLPDDNVKIVLRRGIYCLENTEMITSERIGDKRLTITSYDDEQAIISSSKQLNLHWKKAKGNIWKAACEPPFDQLYVNGEKRILARYPNYRRDTLFNGMSEDALSKKRVSRWKNPTGGYIHSMHFGMWGSQHYVITGKIRDSLTYEGGYQVSRPSKVHPSLRYVENIREELDAPGEWFWDKNEKILYYYPLPDESIEKAVVETTILQQLIVVKGSVARPIKNVVIENITFLQTERTFMQPYEMLLRSDWGIYRGAAVVFENTESCKISGCEFADLGGNSVFVSKYALNDTIIGNHIHHIGGSAICLVGDTSAVRSGAYGYENFVPYENMDLTPGPKNNLYPRQCLVENNLIHDIGTVEKQVAGVEIQIAAMINVCYNSIFDVPRAGINVGDGAFGGHIIEYNDVFNTVLETSDHGAFNSWGRDRYWHPDYATMTNLVKEHPELILSDALYTTTIRNNRFRCDHGWDIDLDDGSSNYHIYNNICLRGGIKLREGFYRKVENNISINNSLHPHVWFQDSHDIVRRNLFMQPYFPIALNGWGDELDYNFFATADCLEKTRKNGTDEHSITGQFSFVDAASGNYTITTESDVFKVGFENFPTDRFGVYSQSLKRQSKMPQFPDIYVIDVADKVKVYNWLGAKIRSVNSLGDRSAFGLPDEQGVVVVDVAEGSIVQKAGLRRNDIIRLMEETKISSVESLISTTESIRWHRQVTITYFRNQHENSTVLTF